MRSLMKGYLLSCHQSSGHEKLTSTGELRMTGVLEKLVSLKTTEIEGLPLPLFLNHSLLECAYLSSVSGQA